MYNRVLFFFLFISCLFINNLYSLEFDFIHNEGEKYRIVSEVFEDIKINDVHQYSTEILNRIAVDTLNVDPKWGEIRAEYQVSERKVGDLVYTWIDETSATFKRDSKGLYESIPINDSLPSVRNIPRFPDGHLEVGDTWFYPAEEVHDYSTAFGIDYRLHIPFRVFYKYEESFEENGVVLDKILINYNIYYEEDPLETSLKHPEWGEIFPQKITGSFNQEYIWSRKEGKPVRVVDRFKYKYVLSDGNSKTFSGISYGKVFLSLEMDKEKIVDEINEEIARDGLENISAIADDEGVKITLEDIRFLPDSPLLEKSEEIKLEGISNILLNLRGRDIFIGGHTARFGTEESSLILSNERASAVANYLIENNIRKESEIVTKGYGSLEPMGDNSTMEGQKMNRRVEIIILEN